MNNIFVHQFPIYVKNNIKTRTALCAASKNNENRRDLKCSKKKKRNKSLYNVYNLHCAL